MASIRDTVYEMMTTYPSLFKTKSDCFHHLFFVNGNGCDWVDGEIVYWVPEGERIEPHVEDEDKTIRESSGFEKNPDINDKRYNYIRLRTRQTNAALLFTLDNFDLIMETELVSFSYIYPYSPGYNLLTEMPDDVKPDWREAIADCLFALTPYFNRVNSDGGKMTKEKVVAMVEDIHRFKEEKFPDVLKSQVALSELISEILKED